MYGEEMVFGTLKRKGAYLSYLARQSFQLVQHGLRQATQDARPGVSGATPKAVYYRYLCLLSPTCCVASN
jgi:hypothetical protein